MLDGKCATASGFLKWVLGIKLKSSSLHSIYWLSHLQSPFLCLLIDAFRLLTLKVIFGQLTYIMCEYVCPWVCVIYSVYTSCEYNACRGQKRLADPLELESSATVSSLTWMPGTEPRSFGRAPRVHRHWAISPALVNAWMFSVVRLISIAFISVSYFLPCSSFTFLSSSLFLSLWGFGMFFFGTESHVAHAGLYRWGCPFASSPECWWTGMNNGIRYFLLQW